MFDLQGCHQLQRSTPFTYPPTEWDVEKVCAIGVIKINCQSFYNFQGCTQGIPAEICIVLYWTGRFQVVDTTTEFSTIIGTIGIDLMPSYR